MWRMHILLALTLAFKTLAVLRWVPFPRSTVMFAESASYSIR